MGTFFTGRMVGGVIDINELPHTGGACRVGRNGDGYIQCSIQADATRDAFTRPWFEILMEGRDFLGYVEDANQPFSFLNAGQITDIVQSRNEVRIQATGISDYLNNRIYNDRSRSVWNANAGTAYNSLDGVTTYTRSARTIPRWIADAISTLELRSKLTIGGVGYDATVPIKYRGDGLVSNAPGGNVSSLTYPYGLTTSSFTYPTLGSDMVTIRARLDKLRNKLYDFGVIPILVGQAITNHATEGIPDGTNGAAWSVGGANGSFTAVTNTCPDVPWASSMWRVSWTGNSGLGVGGFNRQQYDFDFSVVPGEVYNVSVWVNSKNAKTVRLALNTYNENTASAGTVVNGSNKSLSAGQWTLVQQNFTIPANATLAAVAIKPSSSTQWVNGDQLDILGWTAVLGSSYQGTFNNMTPADDDYLYAVETSGNLAHSGGKKRRRNLNLFEADSIMWEVYNGTYQTGLTGDPHNIVLYWSADAGFTVQIEGRIDGWVNLSHYPPSATPSNPNSYIDAPQFGNDAFGKYTNMPLNERRSSTNYWVTDGDQLAVRGAADDLSEPAQYLTFTMPRYGGPIVPLAHLPGRTIRLYVRDHPTVTTVSKGTTGAEYIDCRITAIEVDDGRPDFTIEAAVIPDMDKLII